MNINQLLPKYVNVDALSKELPSFDGTFKEFVDMLMNHETTLLTNSNGDVVNFNIAADSDPIKDQLIGQKFAMSYLMYSHSTLMNWLELVIKAKQAGHAITVDEQMEEQGICYINGQLVKFREDEEEEEEEIELPSKLDIDFDTLEEFAGEEINDENVTSWIKKYLRKTYKHCLARNSAPDILIDDKLYVSDIEWGRPLSQSELDALDY